MIDSALLGEVSPSEAAASIDNCRVLAVYGCRNISQSDLVLDIVWHCYDVGLNVLAPNLRASGQSKGV